jgi:hypothetical protein
MMLKELYTPIIEADVTNRAEPLPVIAVVLNPSRFATDIRMIQDYFSQTIGNVKKVLLTYGPNGRSRGIATIIFRAGDAAPKAVKQLDGVKVDNRPMKVCGIC